jgi:LPS-assembly protein
VLVNIPSRSFRRLTPIFLLLALLCLPQVAAARQTGTGLETPEPVSIEADTLTYDQAAATYRAEGRVELRRGGTTLAADSVTWNTASGEAVARGHVWLTDPVGEMTGEELSLNLDTGRGQLSEGTVFLREQNFHLAGELIEKLGEQTYRVRRGTFTTCDGDEPAWRFGAQRFDVTLGRYARARHVRFYLRDLPVLYIPFVIYPAKTERESGMLMPRYGYSEKRGTQLSLAYYQVIDRNMDATFYLDYFSDLGIGKGIEYRYIFGEESEGIAKLYHISGLEDAEDRHAFDWQHLGTLPGEIRLAADVEYVSSRDYFEDFGEVAEEYNKDKAQSVVSASRNWEKLNLTGQVKYTKDLQQSNDLTLQRLPEVDLAAVRRRLGETPIFFRFDGASTYFWREEGIKGERLNLRPAVSALLQPGRFIEIVPEVGYRERLYWTSDAGPGFEKEGLADFSTRLSTRLSRVYHPQGKVVRKIRHIIEPEILYSYIPPENQDHLPQFDVHDTIGPANKVAYALTNRFTARIEPPDSEPVYHEFLYLRLSQEYEIRESRRELLDPEDPRHPFSDIRAEMILRPTRQSFVDLDLRYDVNAEEDGLANRIAVFNALAGFRDGAGNALALDYRYRREELEYLAGKVDLARFKPVYLNYQQRYDLEGGRSLEQVVNLEFRAQCWSIFLTFRDRLEDQEYLVTFALSGLGKVAQFGGNLARAEEEE